MNKKAQGSLEYLLIIALVVIISLFVVTLALNQGDNVERINQSGNQVENIVGKGGISIVDSLTSSNGDALFSLKNNSGNTLIVKTITPVSQIGNEGTPTDINQEILPGYTNEFVLENISDYCPCSGNQNVTCTIKIDFESSSGLTQSVQLTVTKPCVETITYFTLNYSAEEGGSIVGNINQKIMPGKSGSTVTAEADDGYEFIRWSDGSTNPSRTETNVLDNKNIIAEFKKETTYYTVIFNSQGGTPIDPISNIPSGETIILPENPTRTGYSFLQWNTQADGDGEEFTENTLVTNNLTVYAQWTDLKFYMLNGTIYCPNAAIGETGEVDGITYKAYDIEGLYTIRYNTSLLETACTTHVTTFNPNNEPYDGLFYASASNPNISHWDTSNVTNMSHMFCESSSFNQSIGNWNTKNVTNMEGMFFGASSFNQPIGNWNTKNLTNMDHMFRGASSFNQPIDWNTSKVTTMSYTFESAYNFNQPLNWDTSNVTNMSYTFAYTSNFNQPIGDWNTKNVTNMEGTFWGASSFNQPIDWNTSKVNNMTGMFAYADVFNQPLNLDTSKVTNMDGMFYYANDFNQPIGDWNTKNVTNMSSMFSYAPNFNQPLNFNTINVTDMSFMFNRASNFNQPLNWDTSKVTNMNKMFAYASSFNQDLSEWDVSINPTHEDFSTGATSWTLPKPNFSS